MINLDNMDNKTSSLAFEPIAEQVQSTVVNASAGLQNESPVMAFEPLSEQSSYIKVIGVGGGGGNAVNHMFRQGIHGVDFIVCNTDMKALNASPVPNKIELGKLGAGNVPDRARKAALEHKEEICAAISHNTQMLFITAGMGGGTGTGAAPVIAEIAKSIQLEDEEVPRILVVAIVTMPFTFEGRRRKEQAEAGIKELKKHVDSILVINNDKLRSLGNLPLNQAFSKADDVLLTAAKGIAEIITVSAYVNIDFRDVNTVMEKSGTALMGAGFGTGDNRAEEAIKAATTSVLLDDNDIRGAKNILLYFSYSSSHQINMDELGEVTDYLTNLTGNPDTNVIWGAGDDDSLNDELRITLIATGFEQRPDAKHLVLDDVRTTTDMSAGAKAETVAVQTAATPATTKEEPVAVAEGGRKVIPLGDIEDEMEEDVVMEEPEQPVVAAPQMPTGSSLLDGIRVVPRNMAAPQVQQNGYSQAVAPVAVSAPAVEPVKAPQAMAAPRMATVVDVPVATPYDVFGSNKPVDEAYAAPAPRMANPVSSVNEILTPESPISEIAVLSRAERIRRMNELLHNDPRGPEMVEAMTPAQLSGEPIYETPHSSVSDVARTSINSNGDVVDNIIFLQDLPD